MTKLNTNSKCSYFHSYLCQFYSISDIVSDIIHKICIFAGGRGLKMEMWNNSRPQRLEEVLSYNASQPGYSVQWVDSLSYVWPLDLNYFVARFSGFFVPMETDNYYFIVKADDRVQLYFSKTGRPEDKVLHERFRKHFFYYILYNNDNIGSACSVPLVSCL